MPDKVGVTRTHILSYEEKLGGNSTFSFETGKTLASQTMRPLWDLFATNFFFRNRLAIDETFYDYIFYCGDQKSPTCCR